MAQDMVDVLIIGAGASGAAAAWSLADTRMRIVCLEQGDGLVDVLFAGVAPGAVEDLQQAVRVLSGRDLQTVGH